MKALDQEEKEAKKSGQVAVVLSRMLEQMPYYLYNVGDFESSGELVTHLKGYAETKIVHLDEETATKVQKTIADLPHKLFSITCFLVLTYVPSNNVLI